MKITIIGGGNLGSIFAARSIEGGHQVTVVARNERLEDLRQNGVRIRAQNSDAIQRFSVNAIPALTPDVDADLILVTVQRHQIDAVLPALIANNCPRICFMFNCGEDDSGWQRALNGRLLWAFPAVLAHMKDGVVEYVMFPHALRFLAIMTVGTTAGGDPDAAREIEKLFNEMKIPSVYHEDIRSWLVTHAAVMLPPLAVAITRLHAGKKVVISLRDAMLIARALKEGLRAVSKAGLSVTPRKIGILTVAPSCFVAPLLWAAGQTRTIRKALNGLPTGQYGEVAMMYADLEKIAAPSGARTPTLDRICAELRDFESSDTTNTAAR